MTATEEQVDQGRAVLYVALLLDAFKKPVVRDTLEAGLVLMLNDALRADVLAGKPAGTSGRRGARAHIVAGMDAFLSNLQANGVVRTSVDRGRMVVESGERPLPTAGAPTGDLTRSREAIQAVNKLGERP